MAGKPLRLVTFHYYRMAGTQLRHAGAAPVLPDESPRLCQQFHRALLDSPQGFHYKVSLEGFPPVHFDWLPLCETASALLVPPFVQGPPHDLVAILLNGVETPDELQSIVTRFPLRPEVWQDVKGAPKPLAVGALYTVGRFGEPATITIINAFANSYFSHFGTNEV
jgi:hypothetical protein